MKITIFLGRHSNLHDVEKLFAACRLHACDLLLMEHMNWNPSHLARLENIFSLVDMPPALRIYGVSKRGRFTKEILKNLDKAPCPLYVLDLPNGHPLVKPLLTLAEKIDRTKTLRSEMSKAHIYKLWFDYGKLMRRREDYIVRQFESYLGKAKEYWDIKSVEHVGIFFGATHTRLYHLLKKKYDIRRVFLKIPKFGAESSFCRAGMFNLTASFNKEIKETKKIKAEDKR